MRRAAELIGLPIISRSKGEILGEVEDILFDSHTGELKTFVIKNKNIYYIPVENIFKIGEDLIVVENSFLLENNEMENDKLASLDSGEYTLLGEEVITSDGKELGLVSDLVIDEKNYKMAGYEISGGIVSDILKGRNILPIEKNYTRGEDAVILQDNNLEEI